MGPTTLASGKTRFFDAAELYPFSSMSARGLTFSVGSIFPSPPAPAGWVPAFVWCLWADPGRWTPVAESRSERLELDEEQVVESGVPGMRASRVLLLAALLALLLSLGAEDVRALASVVSSTSPSPCWSSTV